MGFTGRARKTIERLRRHVTGGERRPAAPPGSVSLRDFLALAYGDNPRIDDGVIGELAGRLGSEWVRSLGDMRAIIMMLDRQAFPTPMMIRFSSADIELSSVNGIASPIDRHDMSMHGARASGDYEPHLLPHFRSLCRPGSVVFDIGANVGFHTLMLSQLAGAGGHVYAFDPNSENCRLILAAAEHHGLTNLTLLPIALAEQRGWVHFTQHLGTNGGFVSKDLAALHGHGTVVPTFALDELDLPGADLMKIDVEGAEHKVLRGGAKLLARSRPAIICEFSQEMTLRVSQVEPADFLGWIAGLDYRIFIIDRVTHTLIAVDSLPALFSGWGSHLRIEDLLFVPSEKIAMLG
jgi:FkbM family methyltransferase